MLSNILDTFNAAAPGDLAQGSSPRELKTGYTNAGRLGATASASACSMSATPSRALDIRNVPCGNGNGAPRNVPCTSRSRCDGLLSLSIVSTVADVMCTRPGMLPC